VARGYNQGMEPNPYEAPKEVGGPPRSQRNLLGLGRKPWWGYIVAVVVGAWLGGVLLTPFLAALDDAGGLEMLIGAFLGLIIYGLLF